MKHLKAIPILIAVLGLWLGTIPVRAAEPLPIEVEQVEAFRHVLELNDWLLLARVYLTPLSSTAYTDVEDISTTSGDFDDTLLLTNRVYVTTEDDYTVDAGGTDITDYCFLANDDQTLDCEDTGLGDATYTVAVNYRSGWYAYAPGDVFVQLLNGSTVVAEKTASRLGYGLVGIYLSASDVTAAGLSWSSVNVGLRTLATPLLWGDPYSLLAPVSKWHSGSTVAATAVALEARLKAYLLQIENDDGLLGIGDYLQGDYITDDGTLISLEAFSLIRLAIPEAFASAQINPWPTAITTPATSMVDTIATQTAGTTAYTNMQAVSSNAGLFVTLLGSIIIGAALFIGTKSAYLGAATWFVCMFSGWLLFAIPFAIVFIPAAGASALGFMFVAKKVFD